METGVQYSNVADVTGALEKLRQGNVDDSRRRYRRLRDAEESRTRRSLSPSLCRSYDWNTTHFYPDIHQENDPRTFISRCQGVGRTVRFASEQQSEEEKKEGNNDELKGEKADESEGHGKEEDSEEWRRDKENEEEEEDHTDEDVSSSDDFDGSNSISDNEDDSDGNAIGGSHPEDKATPIVQDVTERRSAGGLSLTGPRQPGPVADLYNFRVGQNGGEKMDLSRTRIEPRKSALARENWELEDRVKIGDDSEWRWETDQTEHQPMNTLCETEDWNQWKFIDEDTHSPITSKKSAPQLRHNGALKSIESDDTGDLPSETEAALTRGSDFGKDDGPSSTGESHRPGPKPPRQNGRCMVTHFDDPWPVPEFGSDYSCERRDTLPTLKSDDVRTAPAKEQYATELGRSLRSILKQNRVADAPTNVNIIEPLDGSDLSKKEPSQWRNTLPTLHGSAGNVASRPASVVDDRGQDKTHETWNEAGDSDREKRWKSESFLLLENSRPRQNLNGKRKRFVIDYRRPTDGHVTSTGSGEGTTIGPFTLNEFELCLEIPAEQPHVKDISPEIKDEDSRRPKIEEIRMEAPANRKGIGETEPGRNDLREAIRDPSSDLVWLFHKVGKSDCRSWKGSRNHFTEFQPSPSLHETDLENLVHTSKVSTYPDDIQKADVKWNTGTAVRQQYRWSTAIREPHARILLDQWNVDPPLSLMPPTRNRYRIVRPGQEFLTNRHRSAADFDSVRPTDSANQNERTFTIAGQPKSGPSLKQDSDARQVTTRFALVGVSRQDRPGMPQLEEVASDWPNERSSTELAETPEPGPSSQKYGYLRERVLRSSNAAVDANPKPTQLAPVESVLLRSDPAHHGLHNLEQMRLAMDPKHSPISYQESWDSHSSRSLLSLPSNLPRQRRVDMSSVEGHDSAGKEAIAARIPAGGQRVFGRRGNACAVVSPMRKPLHPGQNQNTSGRKESSGDRNMPEIRKPVEGGLELTQVMTPSELIKTPAAADQPTFKSLRPNNKKVHKTPRTVKARHEMKARRVRGRD